MLYSRYVCFLFRKSYYFANEIGDKQLRMVWCYLYIEQTKYAKNNYYLTNYLINFGY